jgi:phosphatidylglycerol:prolipoprotein diacylglycerol transferase
MMYPTMFRIPFLPEWLADIKSYGVMMMIAFLSGIWMACRRAIRSQANPDTVLNMGLVALVAGVAGARIMYVWHYWEDRFANQPSPLAAMFDIRAGGLEFWGGPLLTIPALYVYLRFVARVSVRWYLDISAPSLAWGLAVTRIGCFLNGCCWGATCADEHDPARQQAAFPWAVRFPYGSPPMVQQYKFGQLTLPRELIYVLPSGESFPLPADYIAAAVEDGGRTYRALEKALEESRREFAQAGTAGTPSSAPAVYQNLKASYEAATNAMRAYQTGTAVGVVDGQCRTYGLSAAQLGELAGHYRSRPVHPAQLYETISGFLICWLLTVMFYYRRRHGVVLPWFLILYSVSRLLLEAIRQDNPLDVAGITISQAISLGTLLAGLVWLALVYTAQPLFSPRARRFILEEEPARA